MIGHRAVLLVVFLLGLALSPSPAWADLVPFPLPEFEVVGSEEHPILDLAWNQDFVTVVTAIPGEPVEEEDVESTLWRDVVPDLAYDWTAYGLTGRLELWFGARKDEKIEGLHRSLFTLIRSASKATSSRIPIWNSRKC